MAKRAILASVVIVLIVVGLLPAVYMTLKSVLVNGGISLEYYYEALATERIWLLIEHSVILSSVTTLLATVIGLGLGILLGKTDLPFRKPFTVLFTIPLLVPPYITAISWFNILGREGLVFRFFGPGTAQITTDWLFGLPGCILVLFSTFLPIVMLLTIAFLKTVDPRLEEAGRLFARWPYVIRRITIPSIYHGVLLGAMLVFLITMGELGVPTFLRFDVFPVESFVQFSAFYNFGAGTAAAIPLVVITFLFLVLERVFLREKTQILRPVPDGEKQLTIPLGFFRIPLFMLVGLFALLIVIAPFLVLLLQSLSVTAYAEAITKAGDSMLRSLSYAAIGATALTLIGFFCGYLIHNRAFPLWRSIDSMTIFLFALPATVIGIGLVSLWNHPLTGFIYATPAIIIFGYIAQFTAVNSRITATSLARIPTSMDEAAVVSGAGWFRRLTRITVPIARRGIAAGWIIAYILCLRDMGISMMVYPPGYDTLPVRTFTLMANGTTELIAALCIIMILATLVPLILLGAIFKLKPLAKYV